MIQRHQLVQSVLQELQEATECFGLDGLTSAALEAERTLSSFSLPSYSRKQFQEELEIDQVARSLYPEDAPGRMLPLICKGEGNHLFEAASMILWGNTSLSLELQVRTTVEMLLHKQYYLKGMIDSKVMLQAARYSLCTEESPEMTSLPLAVLEAIFDADIKATCFPGTYANMWHVYALASVVQCNIYSIYPMSNLKIRPYFNRLIRPRTCSMQVSTLHIMWSGQQLSSQVFKAQYFVPVVGVEELEPTNPPPEPQVQPVKTLELLNKDPQVTYSDLRERYSITKSTFYRWKRQSREHRQKAAARFAAKHFLQSCFQEGNIVPLQHFRKMFPEISRSTYYAWKHEMQSMLNGNVSSPSEGVLSKDPQVCKPENVCTGTDGAITKSDGGLGSISPLLNPTQNGASMQGAKSYLENSISMNTLVPYRSFKRSFPGISRSTYYNWRRKAMKENTNFKPSQTLSVNQIPLMNRKPYLPLKPENLPVGKMLNGHNPQPRIQVRMKPTLYSWQKQLRDLAKKHVCQWKMPFCKFRLRYPGVSSTAYWFWRKRSSSQPKKHPFASNGVSRNLEKITETGEKSQLELHSLQEKETVPGPLEKQMAQTNNAMIPGYQMAGRVNNDDMFVMDVIATAQFKAQAKLFLQQRFESKTFPTYKEFRARFPLTARSTYYMWKRALHDGLTLVDS
ncbi:vertnin [Sceloporus undulatus]|uniref:vertnin n=1 Tax=Sceloporus undulatus TaxID=8520 RepID=UPI001C4D7A37|nr:vertnin [Sceloporus undulatus]